MYVLKRFFIARQDDGSQRLLNDNFGYFTTALVDQDPSDTPAWTVNSTSIANSRKPLHLMTNAFAVYDISSGVKLLPSTQSTDSIYTGLVLSAVSAHIRDTVEKFKKDTAEFFSEHWFTILIAVSIALPIMVSYYFD
ncbi:hypothetical protein AAHC03_04494 [Spirometra sp. Aus1]